MIQRGSVPEWLGKHPPFFQVMDAILHNLYSNVPEHVPSALHLMEQVRLIIRKCAPTAIIDVLTSLSDGLCQWIGDIDNLLLEHEHNDIVRCLSSIINVLLTKTSPDYSIIYRGP